MPIYEYQARDPERSCPRCRTGFEVVHPAGEAPCARCPDCGQPVRRLISRVGVKVKAGDAQQARVMGQIRDYEKKGMWSHAAELADSHSERTKDTGLKARAKDDYKKAGTEPE